MALSKEALLASKGLGTKPVDIPGVGTVVVRGLSRAEVVRMQSAKTPDEMEDLTLVAGLVEPALTLDEVQSWRSEAGSEKVAPVSDAIFALSGLLPDSAQAAEATFREG